LTSRKIYAILYEKKSRLCLIGHFTILHRFREFVKRFRKNSVILPRFAEAERGFFIYSFERTFIRISADFQTVQNVRERASPAQVMPARGAAVLFCIYSIAVSRTLRKTVRTLLSAVSANCH